MGKGRAPTPFESYIISLNEKNRKRRYKKKSESFQSESKRKKRKYVIYWMNKDRQKHRYTKKAEMLNAETMRMKNKDFEKFRKKRDADRYDLDRPHLAEFDEW